MANEIKFANINDVKSADEDNRIIEFTATKEIKDYDGDVVKIDGLSIKEIKKNKSFLWSHQMAMPPVGKIVKVWKDGNTVKGKAQMTSEEEYPFGFTIYKLIKGGYINNVSISFIPDYETMEYREKDRSRIINDSTLLEISAVNVGANNATTLEAKSLKTAADKAWDDQVLDGSELQSIEEVLEQCKKPAEKKSADKEEVIDVIKNKVINKEEMKELVRELMKEIEEEDPEEEIDSIYEELYNEFNTTREEEIEELLEEYLDE